MTWSRVAAMCAMLAGTAGVAAAQPGPVPGDDLAIPEAPPGAPKVTAVPSAREVMLGEQFYLFISVTHPAEMTVNLPASLQLGPVFEEIARTDHQIRNQDGTYTQEFELALMAFEVGDVRIPPVLVTYIVDKRAQQVPSKPVPIRVISFVGDGAEKLRDIAPPVAVERPDWTLLYVAGGIAGGLILVAVGFIIVRLARAPRLVRRRAGPAAESLQPPHEEALARLDRLEGSGALDSPDPKPAHHELSEIMRHYIGRVFSFPALDLTTLEIRNELLARRNGPEVESLMHAWLERCDLVKFAGAPSTPEEARRALYDARLQIERIRAQTAAAAEPARTREAQRAP